MSDKPPKGYAEFREAERQARKNKRNKDEVLGELESYFSWFLPLLSSFFVIVVGAGLAEAAPAASTPLFFWSAMSLFASLTLAILSRFFIFQHNRFKRESVLPMQAWLFKMMTMFGDLFQNVFPNQEALDEFTRTHELPPKGDARRDYLSSRADEFVKLLEELPPTLTSGLKLKVDTSDMKRFQNEVTKRVEDIQNLKWGPGAWAMRFFYAAKVLFLVALLLLLIQLGIGVFSPPVQKAATVEQTSK